jgi:hypothetical protein
MYYYSDVLQNAVWKALLDLINIRVLWFSHVGFSLQKNQSVCWEHGQKDQRRLLSRGCVEYDINRTCSVCRGNLLQNVWFVSRYFFLNMTFGLRFFTPLHAFSMHDSTTLNWSYHVLQPLSVLLFLDVSCWPYKTHWSFILVSLLF